MARKTKAQKELERIVDDACQRACNGLSINVMKLGQISTAATNAALNGEDVYAAALAKAKELHEPH